MPLVSVIISVKNGMPHLREAIQSVQRQSFSDWELVVVDDGSHDDTWAFLQGLEEPRLHCMRQENTGVATAKNRAIAQSSGPYLAILDADDTWEPEKLQAQVRFLEDHPDYGLVGAAARIVDQEGQYLYTEGKPVEDAENRRMLERKNIWTHSAILFRRTCFEKVGGYYEPVKQYFVDYMLVYQMAQHTKVYQLPQPLVRYRIVPTGLSAKADGPVFRELMMRSVRAGKVTPQDLQTLRDIKEKEARSQHFKQAMYHLYLGRSFLFHNYQPARARWHLRRCLRLQPGLRSAQMYGLLACLAPRFFIDWGYRQFSPNAPYTYRES